MTLIIPSDVIGQNGKISILVCLANISVQKNTSQQAVACTSPYYLVKMQWKYIIPVPQLPLVFTHWNNASLIPPPISSNITASRGTPCFVALRCRNHNPWSTRKHVFCPQKHRWKAREENQWNTMQRFFRLRKKVVGANNSLQSYKVYIYI